LAREPVVDLAADPTDADRVLASAPDGTLRLHSLDSPDPDILEAAPPLVLLEWPSPDLLVGVTASGQVFRSDDAGLSWSPTKKVPGTPEAFDSTEQVWHVATQHGIHRSDDAGATWALLVEAGH
jgi:hypothetical protein